MNYSYVHKQKTSFMRTRTAIAEATRLATETDSCILVAFASSVPITRALIKRGFRAVAVRVELFDPIINGPEASRGGQRGSILHILAVM